jgi:integrase
VVRKLVTSFGEGQLEYEELLQIVAQETRRWQELGGEAITDEPAWFPAFISLLWLTGGRVSEVLAVRGMDIETDEVDGKEVAYITLPNLKQRKNAIKLAIVSITDYPEAWKVIEDYHAKLESPRGLLFHRNRKSAWFHCNRALGVGTHKAGRHSWVMNFARRGANILDIKQMGGWTRMNSMDPYIGKFGERELTKRMLNLPR